MSHGHFPGRPARLPVPLEGSHEVKKKATTSASGNESQKRKRSVLADDPETMMEEAGEGARGCEAAHKALHLEMLCQLETHERLHRHYQSGDIQKCMLYYYLLVMAEDRMRILHHLGSEQNGSRRLRAD